MPSRTGPWHSFFNGDEYDVAAVGRTWWHITTVAADRLGVPEEERRPNRPTGFVILKHDSPQIYADDSPSRLWVALNADALQARPLMSHPSWRPGTPWVLLWRRAEAVQFLE